MDIRKVEGHYEIYDEAGNFICSCDSSELRETIEEIRNDQ